MLSGKGLLLSESNMLQSVLRLEYVPIDLYSNLEFQLVVIQYWLTASNVLNREKGQT